jgi:alkaline phosphatase D
MPTEYSSEQLAGLPKSVFLHGVSSGDPLPNRVIIWTRVTPTEQSSVAVTWEVSRHRNFRTLVSHGTAIAEAKHDFCVSIDVDELQPGTRYYYRFQALGEISPRAQTKTLPADGAKHLRFAQVSCAKYNAGFFNAYSRIAAQPGLDFLLHLGDYIYEASNTPPASQTPGADIGRPFDPLHECKTLDDYRRRYAQYHLDRDVQAMHHVLPIIPAWDDHELADGAWREGASEHKPERDGAWSDRVAAAAQARAEWLPIRRDPEDPRRVHRKIALGGLADLMIIDTRSRRDEPVGGEKMHDPARSALGSEQREWLLESMKNSKAKWRILGNPSIFATTWSADLPKEIKDDMVKVKLIDTDGNGPDYDQWDGYPAERNLLLNFFRENKIENLVVLSGDIHLGMAIELKQNWFDPIEKSIAVEFVNPSLTSQNLDEKMGWKQRTGSLEIEKILMQALPHIRWCDMDSHGYNVVDVTPERMQVEWWLVDTVLERTDKETRGAIWQVHAGSTELVRIE